MNKNFKAFVTTVSPDGTVIKEITTREAEIVNTGEVIIKVKYSSLNFKDTLSANGNRGITRNYPHTPGIDAAGEIAESADARFKVGDRVLVTGYDMGMNTNGGFAEYIKVPADWVVALPNDVSFREAMIYGTAGFTAANAVLEFEEYGITPDKGAVLVNGATGGVGSIAISILAKLGYKVIAASGKTEKYDDLKAMGAADIIGREELSDTSPKPLLKKRWIAALDNVGGNTLSTILRSTEDYGIVCNCGMVESSSLEVSVFPFILRGVRLVGIASAETTMKKRLAIWENIFGSYRLASYGFPINEVSLEELPKEIDLMSRGGQFGRVIINLEK